MTPNCIEVVNDLAKTNEVFAELTVEQLLYAAIAGTDVETVFHVLVTTEWDVGNPFEEPEVTVDTSQDKAIAGALFDFLGFLTTRDKATSFGLTRNPSPAIKLLHEWADECGLDLRDADVDSWHNRPTQQRHGAGE